MVENIHEVEDPDPNAWPSRTGRYLRRIGRSVKLSLVRMCVCAQRGHYRKMDAEYCLRCGANAW